MSQLKEIAPAMSNQQTELNLQSTLNPLQLVLSIFEERNRARDADFVALIQQHRQRDDQLVTVINKRDQEITALINKHQTTVKQHEDEITALINKHDTTVKQRDAEIDDMINKHEATVKQHEATVKQHEAEIAEMINKHDTVVKQHQEEIADMISKHDDRVNQMTRDYERDMKRRNFQVLAADIYRLIRTILVETEKLDLSALFIAELKSKATDKLIYAQLATIFPNLSKRKDFPLLMEQLFQLKELRNSEFHFLAQPSDPEKKIVESFNWDTNAETARQIKRLEDYSWNALDLPILLEMCRDVQARYQRGVKRDPEEDTDTSSLEIQSPSRSDLVSFSFEEEEEEEEKKK